MSLAIQSLKLTSIEAARLWRSLQQTQDDKEIETLLKEIWQTQTEQEQTTDIIAALAEQLDAEIVSVKARMNHLITIHQNAIDKLTNWRTRIDQTILNLNEQGSISSEIVGKQRRIIIKENQPTCDVLIDPQELPEKYQRLETKISANKKAITADWKKGIPVEGTQVYQKRKVVYELLKTGNFQDFQTNTTVSRKSKTK